MTQTTTASKKEKRSIRLALTGLSMGLADLIPGVSGGTIAFLFGIYDELLYSIKLVTGQFPKLLLAGKFKQAFKIIPFGFLIPLGLGMLTAIFGLVHIVSYLLDTQPVLVWALFFGLVLGSAFVVSRRITAWKPSYWFFLILGFVATFILVGLPSITGNDNPLAVFGTGAIAITAMILPGISGSLIMVLLGQYEIIIDAVANRDIITLGFFALGALIGIALFVRLLTWLLKHYHFAVIAFLVGVMAGSLRRIWPWQTTDATGHAVNTLPSFDWMFIVAVLLTIAGIALVLGIERLGLAKEHRDIDTRDFKKEFKEIEG